MAKPQSIIGARVGRVEGAEKVSGQAVYAADVHFPDALWGKILRSPYPHARIVSIDTSKAWNVEGVRAVVTGKDEPDHYVGKSIRDIPVLCWDKVRYIGDKVAAVAAETREAAEDAVGLIEVQYEELPAVFDPLKAMEPGAPTLHDDASAYDGAPQAIMVRDIPNLCNRLTWKKGDIDEGFRESDRVIEHTFRIPLRHQGYIEPQAFLVAVEDDGQVLAWSSSKSPFGTRSQLAKAIGLPPDKVRVHAVTVGGDFGGKGGPGDLPIAYFLAKQAKRPVRIVATNSEELTFTNPDHYSVITVRTGVKRDGRLVARYVRAVHGSGAYAGMKPGQASIGGAGTAGPYRIDHCYMEALQVYTNTVPCGFWRAPGAGKGWIVVTAELDGSFTIFTVSGDQGTGLRTIMCQAVASEMGVPVDQVRCRNGNTSEVPYSVDIGFGGSRSTNIGGHAVIKACGELRTKLAAQAAPMLQCAEEKVVYKAGRFSSRDNPHKSLTLRDVIGATGSPIIASVEIEVPRKGSSTSFVAQVAEVEVDRETGQVKLHRFVTAHDVGTIINPIAHQGQIDGGAMMAIGSSLMEELIDDNGRITTTNLGEYKIPNIADIPRFKTILVHSPGGPGPYEAKGIGEMANVSPPAAIANAVHDACGVRIFDLPISAEKIFRSLAK
ncbi:MAG: xanthine dehydrogenase family protein molybdopterin-binding subunit [Deltaproteobacteria bacterium]|nr:MAG: xanthine dehydrogenase family protein molybdopterin-binding subunit [Deltaproteobacteria bacterium]